MSNEDTREILVAVDGSRNSLLAAGVGARLGRMLRAHLGLVHVLDVPPLNFWARVEDRMKEDIRAEAETMLTKISRRIQGVCDLVVNFYIVEGPAEEELCRLANEHPGVLMVIAGRHGVASEKRSRLTLQHSGDLARKLASQLPVPLLVVPPDVDKLHICTDLGGLAEGVPAPDPTA
jgi:nucleotide-binding universal stress UspA family protein